MPEGPTTVRKNPNKNYKYFFFPTHFDLCLKIKGEFISSERIYSIKKGRFLQKLISDINQLKLQESEVASVKYMSVDDINELIKSEKMTKSHGLVFEKVLEYRRKNNGLV